MAAKHVTRSLLLPYSVEDVFGLVANVNEYCEFLPWCESSKIIEWQGEDYVAAIEVLVSGVSTELVTRNRPQACSKICLDLVRGPFSHFSGEWRFVDLRIGCKATLDLNFEFESRLFQLLNPQAFEIVVDRVMTAFTQRAREILTPCV